MPMNRKLYPKNWEAIALEIKQRNNWTCEKCGRPCRKPGESIDDLEVRVFEWPDAHEEVYSVEDGLFCDVFRSGRFVLTVAHLNHRPHDCRAENLKAWCAPCHGRYDLSQRRRKTMVRYELLGQIRIFPEFE
jgi:5-methylcytosine-specific restriction endonuclease McrA